MYRFLFVKLNIIFFRLIKYHIFFTIIRTYDHKDLYQCILFNFTNFQFGISFCMESSHAIHTQVRIAEGNNTAQYWPNLGSQESDIVIAPVSLFTSVKC